MSTVICTGTLILCIVAGPPGLEPGTAVLETAVLPIKL